MQYAEQVFYIALSQLLFYVWQTWPLILASSALTLLVFAVASIAILKRTIAGSSMSRAGRRFG